ncbi:hypothetical protein [Bacillus velezensis]|uniref:hypothetical protein n=1 Tax=Bacillus velezensis TaxID=492670 RepID=UPI0005EBB571|nr:hypothetical protein [Bacillus velezensis]KJR69293.1 hypothetical protein BAGR45_10585 [Bacillus velezensis]MVZ95803.1 hypothetical protein [Bacillus velezensis]
MNVDSWTVFFLLKPLTTIHTTLLTTNDGVEEEDIIKLAKAKIQTELGLDIDQVSKRLGTNDNFGEGWIIVEQNDNSATDKELELLPVNKI